MTRPVAEGPPTAPTQGFWIAALVFTGVVAAAIVLVGLLGGADSDPAGSSSGTTMTVETAEVSIGTPDEFEAWARDVHGGAAWVSALAEVRFMAKLGSPVIELEFRGDADAVAAAAEQALGALRASDPGLQAWVEAWDKDGQVAGAGFGTPRERTFPDPPADIAGLRDWIDTVYGPSGARPVERWYEAIDAIELGESAAQLPVIRVETSLVVGDARADDRAQLIVIAVSQAAPEFAEGVEVWFADEMGMLSGSLDAYDPYVY